MHTQRIHSESTTADVTKGASLKGSVTYCSIYLSHIVIVWIVTYEFGFPRNITSGIRGLVTSSVRHRAVVQCDTDMCQVSH